jgi:DNA-nicking Smr family endonuclease
MSKSDNLFPKIQKNHGNSQVSSSEIDYFKNMMKDVTPLKKTPRNTTKQPECKPLTKTINPTNNPIKIIKAEPKHHVTTYLSNHYIDSVNSESHISYYRDGICKKYFSKNKLNDFKPQAKLDLHGLNPDSAATNLINFIEKQYTLQNRNLLIIHGKGGRDGKDPILKNLVNHWLPQFDSVLLFTSAAPKDGATGAVYVVLKKSRYGQDKI